MISMSMALICLLLSALSAKRARQLKSWIATTGTVIGANQTFGDSSAVRIQYKDPSGSVREFDSNIQFGHGYWAKPINRIPYKPGDSVGIYVNPKNYVQAELHSNIQFWLPWILFALSIYFGLSFWVTH